MHFPAHYEYIKNTSHFVLNQKTWILHLLSGIDCEPFHSEKIEDVRPKSSNMTLWVTRWKIIFYIENPITYQSGFQSGFLLGVSCVWSTWFHLG